ncbi:hypothetical protein [Gemmatimonas sp.]|uniref:hypothetical protein n=1 Tax=Gemmatimonas sp. TaxID=1962908 RepID=UPI00333F2239
MFGFYTRGRTVAAARWPAVVALAFTTACAADAPLAPSADPGTGSLGAQMAANDSLIKSVTSTVQRAGGAGSANGVAAGGYLSRLPASLALTSAQQAQMNALLAKREKETASDLAAYTAIVMQARSARQSGASAASVEAILATGADIKKRLDTAEAAHRAAIDAILSPAQREWLAKCANGPAFSPAQVQQIAEIEKAFASASTPDVAAIDKAVESIMALRDGDRPNMTTEAKITSILEQITAARDRLRALQLKRDADIANILGTSIC